MWLRHCVLNPHEKRLVDMTSEQFHQYMYSKYPQLFINFTKKAEPGAPLMPAAFGMEINRGWYHVVEDMCRELDLLRRHTGVVVEFTQIKEKYGSARFYYTTTIDKTISGTLTGEAIDDTATAMQLAEDIVSRHEEYTEHVCGELGTNVDIKVMTDGWCHDCGIAGFLHRMKDAPVNEYTTQEIQEAKNYVKMYERLAAAKDTLDMLPDNMADNICDLINTRFEEYKHKVSANRDSSPVIESNPA